MTSQVYWSGAVTTLEPEFDDNLFDVDILMEEIRHTGCISLHPDGHRCYFEQGLLQTECPRGKIREKPPWRKPSITFAIQDQWLYCDPPSLFERMTFQEAQKELDSASRRRKR